MLDDFFISSKVDEATIEKCSKLMIENTILILLFPIMILSANITKQKIL